MEIHSAFSSVSLALPRKPELLFLTISRIQNFTQHVKMKKVSLEVI